MIRGIHHVAVVTQDMEKMLAFYQGLLGFEDAVQMSWEPGVDEVDEIIDVKGSSADVRILRAGNAYLELFKFHTPPGQPVDPKNAAQDQGVRHFALDVTEIDVEYERLLAAGIVFNSPPREVDVRGNPVKAAYFRDPEGNIVELQEVLEGAGSPMAVPGL